MDSPDSDLSTVDAVSMGESKEKCEAYVAFRAASKGECRKKGNFQNAPPTMKIMPAIMDFNK